MNEEMKFAIETHSGVFQLNWFCNVTQSQRVAEATDPALMVGLLNEGSTFETCGDTLILWRD